MSFTKDKLIDERNNQKEEYSCGNCGAEIDEDRELCQDCEEQEIFANKFG